MKYIFLFFFVFLFSPIYGQVDTFKVSYHCTHRMNWYGSWDSVSVDISVSTKTIFVQEVEGILLSIVYDEIEKGSVGDYYKYKTQVRCVLVPATTTHHRIISVLSDNYVCPTINFDDK